ncbi:hypothetical protein ALC56_12589 [Trachymyrmex septentrionalis]|uniref:Uncharacterized protein n=1 Tax=Trachymyrmex septentrionalis TaxID=34720 RepID=A0A195EY12_9HYME|nr:hypothetical protein ALC56_12589 [Trachymyrmex septentrionalis]
MAVKGRGYGFTAIKVSRCVAAVPKLPLDRPEIMRRQSHPRAFFDLITSRKVAAAVPPLSRNAISRPFTTNVSDARIVYVTRLFTFQILQNFSTGVILLKRCTIKSREPSSAPMINRFAECLQNRRVALSLSLSLSLSCPREREREREREKRSLDRRNNSIAGGLKKYHVRRE